jgi:hypothetical protein
MAARRARRNRRVRFRSHRGAGHAKAFRAHKGALPRQRPFGAHLMRALKVAKVKAAKTPKTPKAAAYKGIGTRNPFPARTKAAAFKSALPSAPAAWKAKKRRVAKFKAARPGRA